MNTLHSSVLRLKNTHIGKTVKKRLSEFASPKTDEELFEELCFCILAANAKGRNAFNIQKELGFSGLYSLPESEIVACIKRNKHRFHNNKAKFIVLARKHHPLKKKLHAILHSKGEREAREWLISNVKGIGYKEASHYLRNLGVSSLAILDRHILNLMHEHKIARKPKTLTKKKYLTLEKKFQKLSKEVHMTPSELDLYMWYMKAGEVMK